MCWEARARGNSEHLKVRGLLGALAFSFYCVGPEDQSQAISLLASAFTQWANSLTQVYLFNFFIEKVNMHMMTATQKFIWQSWCFLSYLLELTALLCFGKSLCFVVSPEMFLFQN